MDDAECTYTCSSGYYPDSTTETCLIETGVPVCSTDTR